MKEIIFEKGGRKRKEREKGVYDESESVVKKRCGVLGRGRALNKRSFELIIFKN